MRTVIHDDPLHLPLPRCGFSSVLMPRISSVLTAMPHRLFGRSLQNRSPPLKGKMQPTWPSSRPGRAPAARLVPALSHRMIMALPPTVHFFDFFCFFCASWPFVQNLLVFLLKIQSFAAAFLFRSRCGWLPPRPEALPAHAAPAPPARPTPRRGPARPPSGGGSAPRSSRAGVSPRR